MIGGGAAPPPHLIPDTPAFKKGALGDGFAPKVVDRDKFDLDHERDTADHLADQQRVNMWARPKIKKVDGVTNPDAMVRRDRDDPGTITELKRPKSPSYTAIRNNMRAAGKQLKPWGGGDVVIDGRDIALTESQARQYCREAIAEAHRKNEPLSAQIHVILGDGSMISIKGA